MSVPFLEGVQAAEIGDCDLPRSTRQLQGHSRMTGVPAELASGYHPTLAFSDALQFFSDVLPYLLKEDYLFASDVPPP